MVYRDERIGIAKMLRIFLKKLVGKSRQNMADDGRQPSSRRKRIVSFESVLPNEKHLSLSTSPRSLSHAGRRRRRRPEKSSGEPDPARASRSSTTAATQSRVPQRRPPHNQALRASAGLGCGWLGASILSIPMLEFPCMKFYSLICRSTNCSPICYYVCVY